MTLMMRIVILMAFFVNSLGVPPQAQAQELLLPKPGVMIHLSPAYTPAYLAGLVVHPEDALKFDFLIQRGDDQLNESQKKQEYQKLIKYFLASLTVPDENQWVNLSPYEKDRMIKDDFGKTQMGRDLLGQDYLLKQITASLIYPQDELGKKFWDKVYERAYKEFGSTNIPVNTFNKVWIIPDEAAVYESGNTVYVLKNHLKVMLEEDYMSLSKHEKKVTGTNNHTIASQIIKEIILPELEKEVNEGQNFANLRQIYSGMILATWYKRSLKESLLGKVYANKAKVQGVNQDDPKANEAIYQQYLKAFKKGVFNYIKEDVDRYSKQEIPRKYFSGGCVKGYGDQAQIAVFNDKKSIPPQLLPDADRLTTLDETQVTLNPHTDEAMSARSDAALQLGQHFLSFSQKIVGFINGGARLSKITIKDKATGKPQEVTVLFLKEKQMYSNDFSLIFRPYLVSLDGKYVDIKDYEAIQALDKTMMEDGSTTRWGVLMPEEVWQNEKVLDAMKSRERSLNNLMDKKKGIVSENLELIVRELSSSASSRGEIFVDRLNRAIVNLIALDYYIEKEMSPQEGYVQDNHDGSFGWQGITIVRRNDSDEYVVEKGNLKAYEEKLAEYLRMRLGLKANQKGLKFIGILNPVKAWQMSWRVWQNIRNQRDSVLSTKKDQAMTTDGKDFSIVFDADTIKDLMIKSVQNNDEAPYRYREGVSSTIGYIFEKLRYRDEITIMQTLELLIRLAASVDLEALTEEERTSIEQWMEGKDIHIEKETFIGLARSTLEFFRFKRINPKAEDGFKDRGRSYHLFKKSFEEIKAHMKSYEQTKKVLNENPAEELITVNSEDFVVLKLNAESRESQEVYVNGRKYFIGLVNGYIAIDSEGKVSGNSKILTKDAGLQFDDFTAQVANTEDYRLILRNTNKTVPMFVISKGELGRPALPQGDLLERAWDLAGKYLATQQGQEFYQKTHFSEANSIRTLTFLILDQLMDNKIPTTELINQIADHYEDIQGREAIDKRYKELKQREENIRAQEEIKANSLKSTLTLKPGASATLRFSGKTGSFQIWDYKFRIQFQRRGVVSIISDELNWKDTIMPNRSSTDEWRQLGLPIEFQVPYQDWMRQRLTIINKGSNTMSLRTAITSSTTDTSIEEDKLSNQGLINKAHASAVLYLKHTPNGEKVLKTLLKDHDISENTTIKTMAMIVLERFLSGKKIDLELDDTRDLVGFIKDHAEDLDWQNRIYERANQQLNKTGIQNVDKAMATKGGIDLNAANLDLKIKRDGQGVALPLDQQDMMLLDQIEGFDPVILEIKPALNVPILSDMKNQLGSIAA